MEESTKYFGNLFDLFSAWTDCGSGECLAMSLVSDVESLCLCGAVMLVVHLTSIFLTLYLNTKLRCEQRGLIHNNYSVRSLNSFQWSQRLFLIASFHPINF